VGGLEDLSTSLILWLQSCGTPALDSVFKIITFMGDEKFYLLLLPLVYWCFDKRLGIRLALLVLVSNTVNLWCKYAFMLARPNDKIVRYVTTQEGPGFPSGHTQSATVALGYLSTQVRRWGAGIAALLLILLVGLSRLYLGVHHLYDVVGGLLIGGLMLWLFIAVTAPAERLWRSWPRALRYGVALLAPVLLLAVPPLFLGGRGTEDAASSLGALAGFAVGAQLEGEGVRFTAGGVLVQRLLRFLLGFALVAVIYFGMSALPLEGTLWRFVRYACVGLFASAGAPWLFVRLRLAGVEGVMAPAAS